MCIRDRHWLEEALSERDEAQEWADRLALAIAPQSVIGEHSSANNPGQNALDYIPEVVTQTPQLLAERDALAARVAALPGVTDGCEVLVVRTEDADAIDSLFPDDDFSPLRFRLLRAVRAARTGENE